MCEPVAAGLDLVDVKRSFLIMRDGPKACWAQCTRTLLYLVFVMAEVGFLISRKGTYK
jgi:hypothetical protein